jgi:small subunit ribosomal protein S2
MALKMREMLDAGIHFGHQTKRWNPKMKPYIYGARNGVYIIDLQKTVYLFKEAYQFVREAVSRGEYVLFVGTKRQAQETIAQEADRAGMFYIINRWLGGTLTNYKTIRNNIRWLKDLEKMVTTKDFGGRPKKEILKLEKEYVKLEKLLGGIKNMGDYLEKDKLPGVVFVVDVKKERIAVHEANKLGIPLVGVVDTNSDPAGVDFIVPGNDDSIRAIRLFASRIADACIEGQTKYREVVESEAKEIAVGGKSGTAPKELKVSYRSPEVQTAKESETAGAASKYDEGDLDDEMEDAK